MKLEKRKTKNLGTGFEYELPFPDFTTLSIKRTDRLWF
jgi:hypothetical protein